MRICAPLLLLLVCLATTVVGQTMTAGRRFLVVLPVTHDGQGEVIMSAASNSDSARITVTYLYSRQSETFITGEKYRVRRWSRINGTKLADFQVWHSESEQVLNNVIEISADVDITLSIFSSRAWVSEAWCPLPVGLWGTEYRVASYYDAANAYQRYPGGFIIVASEDDTNVEIHLSGVTNDTARTVKGKKLGDTIKVTLDKGQSYAVMGDATSNGVFDMTGSRVVASHPIALIGFHANTFVPSSFDRNSSPSHLAESIPPVHAWSKQYVTINALRVPGPGGAGRGDVFRLVASQDSTAWSLKYYDQVTHQLLGQDSGVIAKAGGFKAFESTTNSQLPTGVSVWSANKPIMLVRYAAGSELDKDVEMGPWMSIVQSVDHMVQESTVLIARDKGYCPLMLVVRAKPGADLKSLSLDGVPVWDHPDVAGPALLETAVPGRPGLHYVTIFKLYSGLTSVITAKEGVSFVGFMHDRDAAYNFAYPIAGYTGNEAIGDSIAPIIGSTYDGVWKWRAQDQGGSGVGGVHVLPTSRNIATKKGSADSPVFQVMSPVNDASGELVVENCDSSSVAELSVWDFAGNRTRKQLTRPPVRVSIPPSVNVGAHLPGTRVDTVVMVRNTSPDTVHVYRVSVEGAAAFSVTPIDGDTAIAPGDTMWLAITYTAGTPSTGPANFDEAMLRINECSNLAVALRGISSHPQIRVVDRADSTARVLVGTTRCDTQCVEVRNVALVPVTVLSVAMTPHDEIAFTNTSVSGFTLQVGESKRVGTICYTPTNDGMDTTMLTITTSGTGTTTWNAAIRRRATLTSSVTDPLDLPSDVTIIDHVVHAREHTYNVTVYDLLGRVLQTGVVRPGEGLKIIDGYVVVQRP